MRAIHRVHSDKRRPALVLTRPEALRYLRNVTIAPITSTVRGIAVEVPVGEEHGLDHASIVNLDNVTTVPLARLGPRIGALGLDRELDVLRALQAASGLLPPGV